MRYEEENMTIREIVTAYINERKQENNYALSNSDIKKLVDEIADSESFYQRLDDIIEDAMNDWVDELNIDLHPFTKEEDDKREEFFEKGDFIIAPEYQKEYYTEQDNPNYYLWENFKAAAKFIEENPNYYVYTLVEAEGRGYIVKGARWVNRFAYLISKKDTGLGEDEEVRFW